MDVMARRSTRDDRQQKSFCRRSYDVCVWPISRVFGDVLMESGLDEARCTHDRKPPRCRGLLLPGTSHLIEDLGATACSLHSTHACATNVG